MAKNFRDLAGAILAGGKNTRMDGRDKAFIAFNGKPFIERTISVFDDLFEETLIITNSPEKYAPYKDKAIITGDIIKEAGPLGGIYTGLCKTSKQAVFFVGCDMPILRGDIIREQLELFLTYNCGALIPKIGNKVETLHSIFSVSIKDKIPAFIEKSGKPSVRAFIKTINSRFLEYEDSPANRKIFTNINSPQDLKELGK